MKTCCPAARPGRETPMQSVSSYNSFYTGRWWNAVDENLLVEALKRRKTGNYAANWGRRRNFA